MQTTATRPLHPMLQPYRPSPGDPFDEVKAAHLLQRAGFGGTPDEIARVVELGPERAVDELMDFPNAPVEELTQTGGPDLSSIEGYPKTFAEQRAMFQGLTEQERMRLRQEQMRNNREAINRTAAWWVGRMVSGPYPLQEKLVLFWHGHFTTSAQEERRAALIWRQNELHRRMAAGNFREYVRQISRDPAMLEYLNNAQNRRQAPNENYARELMELFTLGRDQYTEADIKEAARAFTGWTHDGEDYVFRPRDHDPGPKTFMGQTGNFGGDDIIDIILQHRACAPYIASRLWNYFAYEPDESDTEMLASLGGVLRGNRAGGGGAAWELRPAIRTLLTSRAFYSPRAMGTQIKSPIQLVVGTCRMLGVPLPAFRVLQSQFNQMGQIPLAPPNVKGWPGGRMWINTSTLFARYNTAVMLASGPIADLPEARGPTPAGAPTTVEGVTAYWVKRLIQRPIAEDRMRLLAGSLQGRPRDANAVRRLIQLIVSTPEYQLC